MAECLPWWGGYFIDNPLASTAPQPRQNPRSLHPTGHDRHGRWVWDGIVLDRDGQTRWGQRPGHRGGSPTAHVGRALETAQQARVADRITLRRCEATSIGIAEPMDFTLAFYSWHEVPDLRRLLHEIHGCLRPQGTLLVVEPIGHVTAQNFQSMLSWAGEIGFTVQERPPVRLSRAALLVR